MRQTLKFTLGVLLALLLASAVFGQQDYIGRYDVYTGFMYLDSSMINLGEMGFHTQVGLNAKKWYAVGFDFSEGTGDTTLLPNMLKPALQQQISSQLAAAGIPSTYVPKVPMHSRSQTYATGPQLNYRHFKAVTLFIHPDLGAIHETAIPHPGDPIARLLVANMAPSGVKTNWTYFYGVGGGIDFNVTKHVGLRVQADFVRDHLFSDLLTSRNSVRFSVGPTFHMGPNVAAQK